MESSGNNDAHNNNLITTDVTLPMQLIHHIFDTYMGTAYKLLIHKEGSSDEDRSKVLSIELIMMWRMEDYFKNVLLSRKLKSRLSDEACKRGYVNTLQWAHANRCGWSSSTCSSAARSGHLSCLQWARESGCPWGTDTCYFAAENGHLSCLQWARENGCPWDSDICYHAARNGHLNCLQWARENGCPWDREDCLLHAKLSNHTETVRWIESTAL